MKKTLLLKTLLLLCVLIVGSTRSAWADETTVTKTINELATANSWTVSAGSTIGDIITSFALDGNITISTSGEANCGTIWGSSTKDWRLYQNKSGDVTVTGGTGVTLKSVTFTYSQGNSGILKDGSKNVTSGSAQTISGSTKTYTVGNTGSGTNGQVKITQISVTYEVTALYTITAQSNNTSYGTVTLSGSVITGSPNAGYRYADPAYTVSPANSATVAQNGNDFTVTPSANTTVTINFEAIPTYTVTLGDDLSTLTEATGGAGVTLPTRSTLNGYDFAGWSETNVIAKTATAPTIIPAGAYYPTESITLYPVYTKTEGSGGTAHESTSVTIADYATANNWDNGVQYASVTLDKNVKASATGDGNTGKYYTSGNEWRFYQNEDAKVTISTTSGELKSVTFTFNINNGGTLNYGSSKITSGTAVDVSGTSADFTVGNSGTATNGQIKITGISINYDITGVGTTYYWSNPVAAAVETPEIVVAENPFLFSTTATITCATEGASIKYSYDGTTWEDYPATALTITETKTIYAKAIKGADESTVAQVTATKNLAPTTVTISGDLTLDLDGGTNVNAGTLTAAVTYNNAAVEGATVTWSSNKPAVATIDETTGVVTIKTTGEVTFTATYAGNSDYAEATGTKTVTVTDSKAPGSADNPYTVAEAIAYINTLGTSTSPNDVYVSGIISQVDEYSSTYKSITYWISDDGTTTGQMEVYSGKGLSGADFSALTDLQVGDIVTVKGKVKEFNSTPEFTSSSQLVSLDRPVAPSIVTNPASLSGFTYVVGNGPSEAKSIIVAGSNLTGNITLSLGESNYEMSLSENSGYTNQLSLAPTSGAVAETSIYVRLKAGLAVNASYSGNITLTSTDATNKSVSLSGSVTEPESPNVAWDLSTATYDEVTDEAVVTWSSSYATMTNSSKSGGTKASNYLGGDSNNRTSSRFYSGNTLTITPVSGYAITSVEFTATSTNYASALYNSTWSNATAAVNESTVTITPTNGALPISAAVGGTCGFTAVKVYYAVATSVTLTPVKTYTTLTSSHNLDFTDVEGLQAYIATEIANDKVQMTQVNKVPAGTGLVLKAATPEAAVNIPIFDGTGADDVSTNNMAGSATTITAIAADDGYILSNGEFHPALAGALAAGKAYLNIAAVSARSLEMVFDGEATGINAIENSELRIENLDAPMYNLAGQRVTKSYKGVVIVNGKKYINK